MDKKGFSLIELMVVVAIISILVTIISLNLRLWRRYSVREGIYKLEDLRNAIKEMRNECGGYPYPGLTTTDGLDALICNTNKEAPCSSSDHPLKIWPTQFECTNGRLGTAYSGNICSPSNEFNRNFIKNQQGCPNQRECCNGNHLGWGIDIIDRGNIQQSPQIEFWGTVLGPYGNFFIRMGLDGTDSAIEGGGECDTGAYCEERDRNGTVLQSGCCKTIGYNY